MNTLKKKDIVRYSVIFTGFMLFIIGIMWISGKSFVHSGDGQAQNYPAFLYIGEWIRHFCYTGNLRLFDFSLGYGEDIIGALNSYGVGDPISILSCLVNGKFVHAMFAGSLFLRLYLAGLGMLLYFQHKGKVGKVPVASSFIYVFSIFTMVQGLWFLAFLNMVYLLPYLILLLEIIIEGNREIKYRILFAVLIAIQASCGFYYLYMQICLMVVFAVIHYFQIYRGKPIIINIVRKIGEVSLFGSLGILLSGIFCFPAVAAFFYSSRVAGDNDAMRLLFSANELLGIFREMVIPNTDAEKNSLGIPLIGIVAVCVVFSKKNLKAELKWMTIIFGGMYLCPLVWSILNGMSYESNRWTYAIYFVISYIVCEVFTESDNTIDKCVIPFVVLACGSIVLHYLEYGAKIRSFAYILLVMGIVLLCWKRVYSQTIWMYVILASVGINVIFMFSSWRISGFNLSEKFVDISQIQQLEAKEQEYQGELERENIYKNGYEVMLNQKNGTAEYLSMLNGNVFDFYSEMYLSTGIYGSRHDLRCPDNRKNTLTLLNIKEYIKNGEVTKNELYKNQGLLYTDTMSEETFMKLSPVERQNAIMKYMVVENDDINDFQQVFEEKEIAFEVLSGHDIDNSNQIVMIETDEIIELQIQSETKSEGVYVLISNFLCYQNDFEVVGVNGEEMLIINPDSKYDTGMYDYLVYVPLNKHERIKIKFKSSGNYSWDNIQIYEANEEYLEEAIEDLSKHSANTYVDNDSYLATNVKTDTAGYFFYSIPYSNNWIAYLDGKKTEVLKANIGFMAVEVPEGEHVIELKYRPIWVYIGGAFTLLAVISLLWIGIVRRERSK